MAAVRVLSSATTRLFDNSPMAAARVLSSATTTLFDYSPMAAARVLSSATTRLFDLIVNPVSMFPPPPRDLENLLSGGIVPQG